MDARTPLEGQSPLPFFFPSLATKAEPGQLRHRGALCRTGDGGHQEYYFLCQTGQQSLSIKYIYRMLHRSAILIRSDIIPEESFLDQSFTLYLLEC